MVVSLKRIIIATFSVYCVLTCYMGYLLFVKNTFKEKSASELKWPFPDDKEDWNPWGEILEQDIILKHSKIIQKPLVKWWHNQTLDFGKQFDKSKYNDKQYASDTYNVEIWGKAAIGLYFWEHIFNGKLESKMDGMWSYGFKKIDNLKIKFRTGPGVITTKVPLDVQNLVLILNGRSAEKIAFAKTWLDYLPSLPYLQNVALILLGDEKCHNEWILPYTTKAGGLVNITYIVYDSPLVDNVYFYQWPLGVATYRQFPKVDPKELDLESTRPYICNFLGTVYPNSSRVQLLEIVQMHNLTQFCFIKGRSEWQSKETKDSLQTYVQRIMLSDLTLNPVGMNTECYRIYEAMSLGSVPVVEDVRTPGICGNSKMYSTTSSLRLLKSLNAPIIYIKNWTELPLLINKEQRMSHKDKIARRIKVIQWYKNFKFHLRNQFVTTIKEKFFKRKKNFFLRSIFCYIMQSFVVSSAKKSYQTVIIVQNLITNIHGIHVYTSFLVHMHISPTCINLRIIPPNLFFYVHCLPFFKNDMRFFTFFLFFSVVFM